MTLRRFATGAALAIAGLAAAVGIGLLANSISGDSVGLGAEPLSAGNTLAPASAKADDKVKQRKAPKQRQRKRAADKRANKPADTVTVQPSTPAAGTVTTFDDHGGEGGDDGSNSGSGSTESGSSGSGSSGSESSGSGGSGSDD
jgi:hypothetical protein